MRETVNGTRSNALQQRVPHTVLAMRKVIGTEAMQDESRGERGAALVEMAFVSLLLFSILFGIIDFGWAYMKDLDVRHGAREVGRLAAVNFDDSSVPGATQGQRIVNAACDRMDGDVGTKVVLDLSGGSSKVKVTVIQEFDSMTGFFDSVLPESLTSTVTMRMEQPQSWDSTPTTPDTLFCGGA